MTAEVAILNHHGIALAADSAVTIGEHRVWKTSNKIFSLGPTNDIAIMIYGSADYSGIPWESIIKDFKANSFRKKFKTVDECSRDFLDFLDDERWYDQIQSNLCALSVIVKEIEDLSNECDRTSANSFRSSISKCLDNWLDAAGTRAKCLPDLKFEEFISDFGGYIDIFRNEKFDRHFPKYLSDKLNNYLFEYFTSEMCESSYETGVVICGFGREEFFPALNEIIVDGRYKNKARAWYGRRTNMNQQEQRKAQIIPFAQRDMAALFMEGIMAPYIGYFFRTLENVLEKKSKEIISAFSGSEEEKKVEAAIQQRISEEMMKRIKSDFDVFRQKISVQPLMSNVSGLPRDEMAAMAEALVELTSLRRKMDSAVQSVAGPVDVAVISKADGLIWVKRKHYFDAAKNDEFFQRKRIQENGHEQKAKI